MDFDGFTPRELVPVSSHLVAATTTERQVLLCFPECFVSRYSAVAQKLLMVLDNWPLLYKATSGRPSSERSTSLVREMSFLLFFFGLFFSPSL